MSHRTHTKTQGFTLMELLIVVAIIAVLVAIAIPMFTQQLERSREATDLANVRSAYAEVMTAAMTEDATAQHNGSTIQQANGSYRAIVSPLAQTQDGWQTSIDGMSLGGVSSSDWKGSPVAGGACTITYVPATGATSIVWGSGMATIGYTQITTAQQYVSTDMSTRIANDVELLDTIEANVNNMTYGELLDILEASGATYLNQDAVLIAQSQVATNGNFRSYNNVRVDSLFTDAGLTVDETKRSTYTITSVPNGGNTVNIYIRFPQRMGQAQWDSLRNQTIGTSYVYITGHGATTESLNGMDQASRSSR